MKEEEFGHKIRLNVPPVVRLSLMQGEPTGIIGAAMRKPLQKGMDPFWLDRPGRRKKESTDTAHEDYSIIVGRQKVRMPPPMAGWCSMSEVYCGYECAVSGFSSDEIN
jgi:hypothetical protein